MRWLSLLTLALAQVPPSAPATGPVRVVKIISRENAHFNCDHAALTVGRDGRVYLCSGGNGSFVIRIDVEGREKYGADVAAAAQNATANADGIIATANAHFAHKVTIYDKKLRPVVEQEDFLVSDQSGWDAPSHVEAGESGDFYGADQHRDRILRITPTGKLVQVCPVPREAGSQIVDFRVCETKGQLYIYTSRGELMVLGFDGKKRWSAPGVPLPGEWWMATRSFDVTPDGTLYALPGGSAVVKRFGPDGKALPDLKLSVPPRQGTPAFFALRVAGKRLIVRSPDATEFFQCYDLDSGAFQAAVKPNLERLSVEFPSSVWTAGDRVPFTLSFDAGGQKIEPRWRVWARPLDAPGYVELKQGAGGVAVPSDAAGLYRIKVSPEAEPRESMPADPDYVVETVVEIRQPRATGSVAVCTPEGRIYFGQGETIPVTVVARGPVPEATLRLLRNGSPVVETRVSFKPDPSPTLILPPEVTAALLPGEYVLGAEARGTTCVPQKIVLGTGTREAPFHALQYGDYTPISPVGRCQSLGSGPDVVQAWLERTRKMGLNLIVERTNYEEYWQKLIWNGTSQAQLEALAKRLEADPAAVTPRKAAFLAPLRQLIAGYGAQGVQFMPILLWNDAGLPLGQGFDRRSKEQLLATMKKTTELLRPFPAMRGWSWASNWWLFSNAGSAAAATPEEKRAYEAAFKKARESGRWDPVLDTVSERRFRYAVEAQEELNGALTALDPSTHYVRAVGACYRNVNAYPPITFSNMDESDLHAQWEQMAPPYHNPHNVDFYKRPGKRAWAHPEIWNDDGTGGQVVPELLEVAMRGGDGAGCSGEVPPWAWAGPEGGELPDDPRTPHYGEASVYRSLNRLFREYGPLFPLLEKDDQVAIAVSGRMYRLDDWGGGASSGLHFSRHLEAYAACLHSHHPASFVFPEDLRPDTFRKFKAVLVVGQKVDLEPGLADALKAAKTAGVAVFFDGTCRPDCVAGLDPLGDSFDRLEHDSGQVGDDSAYWRAAAYARDHARILSKLIDPLAPPPADVGDDQIFISQSRCDQARYLWVVNHTLPRLDPGQIWRMTLGITSRMPLVAPVKLSGDQPGAVYDVFARKEVSPAAGTVTADLRTLTGRLYAILPASIANVDYQGPVKLRRGERVQWRARATDARGEPVAAAIPFRVRLLAADGAVLVEKFLAGKAGAIGDILTGPINAPQDGLVLEISEWLGGKSVKVPLGLLPADAPPGFVPSSAARSELRTPILGEPTIVRGAAEVDALAVEEGFGPHVRDLIVTRGGTLAVMNAMNWDHNLFAVNTETGQVEWRRRLGHYFAFSPQSVKDGLAVQAFDFKSAEGYHLYLLKGDGTPEHRFALYGVPTRLPFRFIPGILHDAMTGPVANNFATSPDGSWVATAGDLGMAVWTSEGKLLWHKDWWKEERHTAALAASDPKTLVAIEGMKVTAYGSEDGRTLWTLELANGGIVRKVVPGADGRTLVVTATTEGGRVFVLQDGKLVRAFATKAQDVALAPDQSTLAVTTEGQLKLFSIQSGLQWIVTGDDRLRMPRFSPDGKRLSVTSDLGTLYVLGPDGSTLLEKDLGTRGAATWLPKGDLLVGTWSGTVLRLATDYNEVWRVRLTPVETDLRDKLLKDDGAVTAKMTSWGNAEPAPRPVTPNLLAGADAFVQYVPTRSAGRPLALDCRLLYDGKPAPRSSPWVDYRTVGFCAEQSPVNSILIDTFRTQLRVDAITFVEDPAHPESWLRDARLEYWDAQHEKWVFVAQLLSDLAVHTHKFAKPIEAARFRLMLPWGMVGSIRWEQLVFHGEALGCSHPDVQAKHGVAVLFDEDEAFKDCLLYWGERVNFKFDGAFSGNRCLWVGKDNATSPHLQYPQPFSQCVPNWDFEIAEHPRPGQYRYLQFAWKAAEPGTKTLSLRLNQRTFHAGDYFEINAGDIGRKLEAAPPAEWKIERVDLWEAFGHKPTRIRHIAFAARGGAGLFDRILLGSSEKELDADPALQKRRP